jgi:hypothetical protein
LHADQYSTFVEYQLRTARRIPVILLERLVWREQPLNSSDTPSRAAEWQ